jgi:AraC-like DNA-binding protein
MKYCTRGEVFFTDYEMPLYIDEHESFTDACDGEFYYKILFLTQGKSALSFPGGKLIAVAPLVFCLNGKERLEFLDTENAAGFSIYFRPQVINSILTEENLRERRDADFNTTTEQDLALIETFRRRERKGPLPLRIESASAQRLLALSRDQQKELDEQNSNELWPCRSRSLFLEVLFLLSRISGPLSQQEDIAVFEEEPGIDLDAIILYLHSNYMRKIGIDKLAKHFRTNRTTLAGFFKRNTGDSIHAYLIKIWIDIASMMLRNTKLPISEIAGRAGFKDLTHFARMFKKAMNHTPSVYRERYCWMGGAKEALQEREKIAQ